MQSHNSGVESTVKLSYTPLNYRQCLPRDMFVVIRSAVGRRVYNLAVGLVIMDEV